MAKKEEMIAALLNNSLVSNDVALIALQEAHLDVPFGARETEITIIFRTNGVTFGDDDEMGPWMFLPLNLRSDLLRKKR